MATTEATSYVAQIGQTAGLVWKALSDKGPLTLAKLIKTVGEPRDNVMQAIGWLAREEKILVEDQGRTRVIALR